MVSSLTVLMLAVSLTEATVRKEYGLMEWHSAELFENGTSDNMDNVYQTYDVCNMTVDNHSIEYFRSRLESGDLDFIRFTVTFNNSKEYNYTPETFRPDKWAWTYKSSEGLHPFLHWNIDYTILSFGLLNAKTLSSEMFIRFNVPDTCHITFGTRETTQSIAVALGKMTQILLQTDPDANPKYEESFYCYLAEEPNTRNSISYKAAVYFMYPISYINYNCCATRYSYTKGKFFVKCLDNQIVKWPQCLLGPYIISIIIFIFYPILHMRICAWIASDEQIEPTEYTMLSPVYLQKNPENIFGKTGDVDDYWLYLNGDSPYNLTDLFTHIWCGLNKTWPTTISRIRRLGFLIALPVGVYVQIMMYHFTMKSDVELLVKHRSPIGFLSLLGDQEDRVHSFATLFGGPVVMAILYYVIGLLTLVVPRSVKQIYEDGVLPFKFHFKTPLCLSVTDVKLLSNVDEPIEPGYINVKTLLKCGIYMLFSKQFWAWLVRTQIDRIGVTDQHMTSRTAYVFKIMAMPFYITLCIFEIAICIIMYGVPVFMFTLVSVRGATRSLVEFRRHLLQYCQHSRLGRCIFDNHPVNICLFISASVVFVMFAYVICLIFLETFAFMSQVIVFCFVAVIVYPSVAFGYLFFFVALMYYIFRRIRDFGECYLELLSEAVDISRNLDSQPNYVSFYLDNMMISNVRAPQGLKGIQLNTTTIDVASNVWQTVLNETDNNKKCKCVNNVYGIPKDLFHFLVKRHRPAHQQALKVVLHIIMVATLIAVTMSISCKYVTGPSSEISDVMHVIFIVGVGALPRVLEIALTNASASIKREIELRSIEQSVLEYWTHIVS